MTGANPFSVRLRQALEEAGVSAAQLAERVNVTRGMVSHWLTGRRSCSDAQMRAIAKVLHVDSGWLSGAVQSADHLREGRESMSSSQDSITSGAWHFRPAPDDGGRDFGNPNVFAAPAELQVLVRETGQNTNDVPLHPGGEVHMRFRVIELTRGRPEYADFLEAIRFQELKTHIHKAAETDSRVGTRLRGGLEYLAGTGKLMLLRIDDYGTTGLFGAERSESGEKNPFAALVRNNLDSSKLTTTAGGSFGLGKALLWRCSDLSTVFFASEIASGFPPEEQNGIRFIGKTELTWHQLEEPFAGPGWLGRAASPGDSLWLPTSALDVLQMNRRRLPDGVDEHKASGTSILILGFRDPQVDGPVEPKDVVTKLVAAAAENFWPLMREGRLRVSVERQRNSEVEDVVPVDPTEVVPEFCDAYDRYQRGEIAERLSEGGDVVSVAIPFSIPRTRPNALGVQAYNEDAPSTTQLIVRLGEDSDVTPKTANSVALVRGRRMVVKYWSRSNIVVGAQPFHAVLLAGEAVGNEQPQLAAEQFLRFAEPPAHDEWEFNDDLREKYQRGAGARLKDLFDNITRALQEAIRPAETSEGEGPRELRQLFRIGGQPVTTVVPATIRQARAEVRSGAWEVSADIHVNDRSKRWMLIPRLWLDVESGSAVRLSWHELNVVDGAGVQRRDEGFLVESGTRHFKIAGRSESESEEIVAARCRARLDLRVEGPISAE